MMKSEILTEREEARQKASREGRKLQGKAKGKRKEAFAVFEPMNWSFKVICQTGLLLSFAF
jgi:hypothetical protein